MGVGRVSETDTLVRHEHEGIVTLTLNRPKRKNGITVAMVDEAIAALDAVWADPDSRVLVLTGAQGSFCSGMDLSSPIKDEFAFMKRVGLLCRTLHDLPLPTIADVRGGAIGFGANLALCCDFVLAADDAVFGEIFAERGLGIDGGGSWSIPRSVGLRRAKELLFFGSRISGREAADLGLINRAVPAEELDTLVADWSERLAKGPRRALALIKAQIDASFESSFAEAVEAEVKGQTIAFRSSESREGVKAFMEGRTPDFRSI